MQTRAPQTLAVAFPSHHPRPMTGVLELALAQAAHARLTRPQRVGRVLEVMFDKISGQPATSERVRRLASSAREWLLQQAALRVWPDRGWFQARCRQCDGDFDLPVQLSAAPRKPADLSFPEIEVKTSLGVRRFEAPNGGHEELLAQGVQDPVRRLVALCGLGANAAQDASAFTSEDLTRIDDAFEAACPDVADAVTTSCPACAAEIEARIDPLEFAFPRSETLLREVHLIAGAYRWSEPEILDLPATRRAQYAELIRADRRRGA